ncbi:MAG: GHKL domain-containing protein [Bacteroidetes bacterium]|nr:GHKL domain-containing protein [Bacteroidota bacterium]MBS1973091.1 GHKL domain-containing protein [Bacteroidota bacterium]
MKPFLKVFLRKNLYLLIAAISLLVTGYIARFFLKSNFSDGYWRNSVQNFLQKREKDFLDIAKNQKLLHELATGSYDGNQLKTLADKNYTLLLYKNDDGIPELKFWNNQQLLLSDSILKKSDGNYFLSLLNGEYECLKRTVLVGTDRIAVIGMLPVRNQYYISITSFKPEFKNYPLMEDRFRITQLVTGFPVQNSFGQTLFYLEKKETAKGYDGNWIPRALLLASILLFLIVVHNLAEHIAESFGSMKGIVLLVAIVLAARALVYAFPSLLHLRQFELFDPAIYSSSFILSSLGDLLINSLLLCWIVLFIKQQVSGYAFPFMNNHVKRWGIVITVLLIILVLTFVFSNTVLSLVADARISFSVTNFFSLKAYSFIGFIVLATLALSYFFITQLLLNLISRLVRPNNIAVYVILAFLGLLLLTFLVKSPDLVSLDVIILLWLLVYIWLMQRKLFSSLNLRLNISEVLFWLFIFSASISSIIFFENKKIELEQRTKTADRLAEQANPSSERLMSIVLAYLDNDFFYSNFHRFADSASNEFLKDSLVNSSYTTYRDKYDMKIYTYDTVERPLFNPQPASFDTLNTIFNIQGKTTNIDGLRYYEKSYDKYTYIYKKVVRNSLSKPIGYVFILSDRKSDKGDVLTPELFQQKKEFFPEYSPVYSYAIYNNNELIDYSNNYPFPYLLNESKVPKVDYERRANGSYDELWHKASDNEIVVVAKKDNSFIEAVTLFAYLFSAFLVMLAIVRVVAMLIATRLQLGRLRPYLQLNIRSQIHTTIIFISIFSFLVIGTATILFFINRYTRDNQVKLSKDIKVAVKELQDNITSPNFNDSLQKFEFVSKESLENTVNNLSEIHGSAINLYNLDGDLEASSNPFVYDKGILSKKMDPIAYYNLHEKNAVEFLNQEKMSKISYLSVYCPIRNEKGKAYAYLNIPSFTTQDELKQEISNFLVAIVILNAFIYLVAGTIALILTNRITSSFTLISEKMKEVNLGKTNEPVEWGRDDEIGGLVKEYNKMVKKLEESAVALGKSEREGAWREMARQVAHEIKNPLTPMKLSIQYLQKAIDNDSANVKEMAAGVAKTLVEQIDHLAKIAADFSQFANIGNPKLEVFDLHDMLYSLSSLYETTENLLFKWVPVHQKIFLNADKTQLNRLFTNLLQNAVEACENNDKKVISISEELKNGCVVVKVSDNGEGIPVQTRSKIFTPNFTTKSSGTGLGLAMSKTIVEQAKGKIWFDTKEKEGTTFFVELPLAEEAEQVG